MLALMGLLLLTGVIVSRIANAQTIWFGPHSGHEGAADVLSLFEPDAPWQKAASRTRGFQISDELIYDGSYGDGELRKMFNDIRRRGFDLVVEIGAVTGQPGKCGYNVEGYGLPESLRGDAARMKTLGAEPRYFVMDQPLYSGHVFDRDGAKVGCQLPISELASDVAKKLRQARDVFPKVRFGDEEPLTAFNKDTWLADLTTWFDAYESATGDKLAFFRLDLEWNRPWRDRIPPLKKLLQEKGIPLQVIYNGTGRGTSDEEWIESAVTNFQSYESEGRGPPDVAVFQYWTPHPSHVLPETDARTATWLVNRYLEWRQGRQ